MEQDRRLGEAEKGASVLTYVKIPLASRRKIYLPSLSTRGVDGARLCARAHAEESVHYRRSVYGRLNIHLAEAKIQLQLVHLLERT